ncbi:hypothetical protein C8R44DRAFT_875791 [Mycena epipterygia]|nr:hypothetical protein C8R44DRAFT_875791 [Mycena epipterygia]
MEAKLKTPTCSRCKVRKIRCDGLSPCISCSTAKASCEYPGDEKQGRFNWELRKGAACLACRRKKKKCNGQLPCRTCASSRRVVQCEYPDGNFVMLPPQRPVVPMDIPPETSTPGSSTESPTHTLVAGDEPTPPKVIDISDPSPFTLPEFSASPPATYVTFADSELSQARLFFLEGAEKHKPGLEMAKDGLAAKLGPEPPSQPGGGLAFVIPPSESPFFEVQPPGPDSTDDDELSQIRNLFLNHRIQFGLSVPDGVLEAISRGDELILHGGVLHACQLMGYMLARHLQRNTWVCLPGQSAREAEQTQLTLHALRAGATCTVASLQTSTLLSLYFFNKGDIARAREFLATASSMVVEHELDVKMLDQPPPANARAAAVRVTPTGAGEAQAALSQLVYLDLSYTILLKLPSIIDPRIHANFKKLISAPNAHCEINFMRAKSAFLLSEVGALGEEWHRPGLGTYPLAPTLSLHRIDAERTAEAEDKAAAWQRQYWDLMEALDAQRSVITLTLTRIAFCPTLHVLGLSLKVCAVLVLTGLAQLLALFAPDQEELGRKKVDAIFEIISISTAFGEEDCEHLDPILSACWTAVIGTLNSCVQRLESGPPVPSLDMYNVPAMAGIIRQRNKTLQRVLPFALEV